MTTTRFRAGLLFTGIAGSAALAACGGGAGAPAKAPAAIEEDSSAKEPTSVAEAQDQIERARASLDASDKKKSEVDKDSMSAPGGMGVTPGTSATTPAKPSTSREVPREEAPKANNYDSCSSSCKALSSMRRAVSALCRMTGDTDNRCSDARRTLQESESRVVAQCHCSP